MSKATFLRPRLSEQSYAVSQQGVYIFDVPKDANKHTVARAVAAQFNAAVETVNIANVKGKAKRTISLTGRRRGLTDGVRSDYKKAYVTLAKGASLPIFAAVEEAQKKETETQEKMEKALEKQQAREAKQAPRGSRTASRVTRLFKKQGDK